MSKVAAPYFTIYTKKVSVGASGVGKKWFEVLSKELDDRIANIRHLFGSMWSREL